MSGPARTRVLRSLQDALTKWPRDPLRPECQLQDVVGKRLEKELSSSSLSAAETEAQLKQVNALYSLVENRYQNKYKIVGNLMEPRSNSTHYTDLIKELQEAPNRTFFGRLAKKLGGLIRFS
jgi:cytochrome b pre-mRNA-processing protein 6